jgi:hypothetical protein
MAWRTSGFSKLNEQTIEPQNGKLISYSVIEHSGHWIMRDYIIRLMLVMQPRVFCWRGYVVCCRTKTHLSEDEPHGKRCLTGNMTLPGKDSLAGKITLPRWPDRRKMPLPALEDHEHARTLRYNIVENFYSLSIKTKRLNNEIIRTTSLLGKQHQSYSTGLVAWRWRVLSQHPWHRSTGHKKTSDFEKTRSRALLDIKAIIIVSWSHKSS